MAKKDYDINYVKTNIKRIPLNLNKIYDMDIISYLEGIKNVSGYLKDLIRRDMKKTKKGGH